MNFPPIYGKKTAALAGAVLLCGSMGLAQMSQPSAGPASQTPGQNNPTTDPQLNGIQGQASAMDKMFVAKAMQGGMAEVQLGQLTLQKSSDEQVKQFAQKMIDDHSRMIDQMKPVAQQLGVSVPNKVSKKDTKTMAK